MRGSAAQRRYAASTRISFVRELSISRKKKFSRSQSIVCSNWPHVCDGRSRLRREQYSDDSNRRDPNH